MCVTLPKIYIKILIFRNFKSLQKEIYQTIKKKLLFPLNSLNVKKGLEKGHLFLEIAI